jgi:oligopeptide transport system permease protein
MTDLYGTELVEREELADAIGGAPGEGGHLGRRGLWRVLRRKPVFVVSSLIIGLMLVMAAFPGPVAALFGHGNPHFCDLTKSGFGPSSGHPFGYDIQGCDLYANVIYGARASISIGLLSTSIMFVIAALVGSVAGYYQGVTDALVSRVIDVFLGFPFLLGAIIILTVFSQRTIWTVSAVLALFSWPTGARLVRSSVLSARNSEYVVAAKALGARDARILFRHVLPNSIAPLFVVSTLLIGGIIAAEAALTYLGVGLRAPAISWGLQLSTSQGYLQLHPHLLLFPAGMLSFAVLGFILLGDTLQDVLDPRTR